MSEARVPEIVEEPTSALVAQQNAGIVRAAPGDVAEAFAEYQRIQAQLDRALPDCIMTIQGRKFRKKAFWRAVGTAFNLQLEMRSEQRVEIDGDWGYLATYRATAPNGRYADGDGTCMASEKKGAAGTLHNVRAHAHTRAKNRAISDLVGFGEVSAEEMQHEEREVQKARQARKTPQGKPVETPRDAEWLDMRVGYGKKEISGRLVADYTWREMAQGEPGGGRHAWLKSQVDWLQGRLEDKEYGAWSKRTLDRVIDTIQRIEARDEVPFDA